MRFKDLGTRYIFLEADATRSCCNVRRPQRDIAGEGLEDHEIASPAAEGYGYFRVNFQILFTSLTNPF